DGVSAWMLRHPGSGRVSHGRAGDYAPAAARGAPQVRQCADRFHVLKDLGEALGGVLPRHLAAHRTSQAQQSRATPLSDARSKQPPKQSPKEAELSQAKREERLPATSKLWLYANRASRKWLLPAKSG